MDHREKLLRGLLGQQVHVVVDRPIGYRHGDIVYPINYGYLPGVMAADGEEQDAYILGVTEPVAAFDGRVIGAIRRKNDIEDKLVVAPEGEAYHQGQIAEAVRFQEQYFVTSVESLFQKSCGVIPYRLTEGQREYLLVFEEFSQCWSLPKGRMEAGETEAETALRELFEETGLTARLDLSASAMTEYPIFSIGKKQVVFFLGEVTGTPRARQGEISRCEWVRSEELDRYLFPDTLAALRSILCSKSPERT